MVTPWQAVRQSIRILPFDDAVALVDSALNGRGAPPVLDGSAVSELRRSLPRRLHAVLDAVDGRSESGAESIARVRLLRAGFQERPQVAVLAGIRVDLLVGDRLVVEIGSREFHAIPEQYEADHARATTLQAVGFDYLEFTTDQVMNDWDAVESVIAARVANQQSDSTRRSSRETRHPGVRIAG